MLRVAVIVVAVTVTASAQSAQPPAGFRFPIESDLTGDWKDSPAEDRTPFHARGDFNGDNIQDDAWLLPSTSAGGFGVFVFLGSRSGLPRAVKLAGARNDRPQLYGLGTAKPGQYETACGKGYWDCKPGEPDKLNLKTDAIEFWLFESSSSIFWWDASMQKFQRTWTSD